MNKTLLCIYGTLQHPRWNMKILGQFTLAGNLYDLGPFPGVTALGGDNRFKASVTEIDTVKLQVFDAYEGVDAGLYRRELISTPLGMAHIYIYNRELPGDATLITEWDLT